MKAVFGKWTFLIGLALAITTFILPPAALAKKEAKPAQGKPVIIGAPLPTGFLYGWTAERAMRLAIEEINAKGGVKIGALMHPLKLEVIDTRDLEPAVPVSEALLAVEKLILGKKADFIVGGPARSEAALATLDMLTRHKKVAIFSTGFLSPALQTKVTEEYDKYKYAFRISGSAPTMVGEMLALFDVLKKDHNLSKVAILVQDVAHARGGGKTMSEQLLKREWQVLGPTVFPTGTLDFSYGLFKARDFDAQVLFIWMDMPESAILLKQWYDMRLPAIPYGFINAAEQPGFWEATKGKGEFTIVHLVNAGNAYGTAIPLMTKFFDAYKKRWKIEPEGYCASSSYQTIYTLANAIERAGSLDPEAVITALEETDMPGVYGRIRFNKKTHQVIPSMDPAEGAVPQVIQWQNKKRETVHPSSIATSPLKLPPWMK